MTLASQTSGSTSSSGTNIFLNESFSNADTLSQKWTYGKSSSHSADPAIVQGALRLTNNNTDQGSFAIYNQAFAGKDGFTAKFDLYAYGGSGADGISFFLVDGQPAVTEAGAWGGALGYASSVTHGKPGMTGGYVGIGFDAYGNFSNPADSAAGGPGLTPDSIGVRGSQANDYRYLTGTSSFVDECGNCISLDVPGDGGNRDNAKRSVLVDLSSAGLLNVSIDLNADGDFLDSGEKAITQFNLVAANGALPNALKFGFAAATGCSTNIHEIDNLVVKVGGTGHNPPIPPVGPPTPPPIPPVGPPTPPPIPPVGPPTPPPIPPVGPPTPPPIPPVGPPTPPPIPPVGPPTPPPIPPVGPPTPPPIPPVGPPTPPPIPPVGPPTPPPSSGISINIVSGAFNYVEKAAPSSPISSITVNGNGQLNSATVQIVNGFNSNQDRLSIIGQSGNSGQISGLNWVYNSSTGSLTISGAGNAQAYQTALQSVVYDNTSSNPSIDNRTIRYIVTDGATTATSNQTFSITATDDAPTFTIPDNLSVPAGTAGAVITSIVLSDPDTPVGNYTLTVVNAQGQPDNRFVVENGQLKLSPTTTISAADSPITVRILANDGAGNIYQSDSLTIAVGSGSIQLPGLGNPVTYTEAGAPVAIANGVTLTGGAPNQVINQATVSIGNNFQAGKDILSIDGVAATSGTVGGLNWVYAPTTGILTLSGNGSATTYQNALRQVTYSNNSLNPGSAPRSINYTIGGGATPLGSGGATVNVVAVDNLGILTLPQNPSIASNTPGAVVATIAVDDPDTTYTYTVNDPRFEFINGQLRLKAGQSITSTDPVSLVITATGDTPGVAPLTGTLNVSVVAGGGLSVGGLGSGGLTYTENAPAAPVAAGLTLTGGTTGSTLNGAQVSLTGFTPGDQLGITGAAAGATTGTIAGTTITWTYAPATGTITFAGAGTPADYQTALRQVVYSNSSDNPSTAARTIQYTVGSGPTAGQGAIPLTVTAVNDAPTSITFTPTPGPIAAGGVLGVVAIQDPDSTTFTYTFTVNGAPDNRFEIVPGPNGTQVLQLKSGQTLTAPVNLTIGVSDGGTPAGTFSQAFAVNPGSTLTPVPQSDALFFDAGTRKLQAWILNNGNQLATAQTVKNLGTSAIGTAGSDFVLPAGWTILKTGDINKDGTPDLLAVNAAGNLQVYYLAPNGGFIGTLPITLNGSGLTVPAGLQFAGLADMNGDGNLDIVTQNPTLGTVQIWQLNSSGAVIGGAPITVGTTPSSPTLTGNPNWQIVGIADFTGDGKQDLLFRREDINATSVWQMNGTQFGGATGLATPTAIGFPVLDAAYKFAAAGDFNGDGKADIIWRNNAADSTLLWTTSLVGAIPTATQTTLPTLGSPGWVIAGATNINSDNTADVVIRNTALDQQVVWLFNNGVPQQQLITTPPTATTPAAPAKIGNTSSQIIGLGEFGVVTA